MEYNILSPPFTLKFKEMPKSELKKYFNWFMDIIPKRIKELECAVRKTESYEFWCADFSPESLSALGNWFSTQVEKRKQSKEEIEEAKANLIFPIDVSDWELTNRTFSLAIDIGIYLAKTLEGNFSQLKWNQPLKNKKFADYGQPILEGFGHLYFNPVRILVALAYGIAEREQTESRLHELYEYWSKQVTCR